MVCLSVQPRVKSLRDTTPCRLLHLLSYENLPYSQGQKLALTVNSIDLYRDCLMCMAAFHAPGAATVLCMPHLTFLCVQHLTVLCAPHLTVLYVPHLTIVYLLLHPHPGAPATSASTELTATLFSRWHTRCAVHVLGVCQVDLLGVLGGCQVDMLGVRLGVCQVDKLGVRLARWVFGTQFSS